MKIKNIIIYDEPTVPQIQIRKLGKFLESKFSTDVQIRDNFFKNMDKSRYASTRVLELKKPFKEYSTDTQIKIEKDTSQDDFTIHDGFKLQCIISDIIKEHDADTLHIILTNKLIGTFSDIDNRYHARAIIASNPAIISTSGMIEAPAKPRRYYVECMGVPHNEIANIQKRYKGQFLEYHDMRLSEATAKYALQAIFYAQTGEAFCSNKDCVLYNAHWQSELLKSLDLGLCDRHSRYCV